MYTNLTFDKYYRLLIASQEGELDNVTIVSIVTGQSVDYWKQSTDRGLFNSILKDITNNMNALNGEMPKEFMGVETPKDLGYVPCGVYEDAKIVAKKIYEGEGFERMLYYPELIAGYFQWKQDGNYDSSFAKKLEDDIWKQNASHVVSICSFFFENLNESKAGTQIGLPSQTTKVKKWKQAINYFTSRLGL